MLSHTDIHQIQDYCNLDRDVIIELCDILEIKGEGEFSNLYEGNFTEEQLIEKKEEFYAEHRLGSYREVHSKDDYIAIPDTETEDWFHWFNKPDSWENMKNKTY